MRRSISSAGVAAAFACALAVPAAAAAAPAPRVAVLPLVAKVRPSNLPATFRGEQVVAARGERRGFQVAVRAAAGVPVALRVQAPRGFGPRVFVEGLVDVREASAGRPAANAGPWPDVLVPGRRLVGDGSTRVFLVDVGIPARAAGGRYAVRLTLTVGGRVRRLRALVRVVAVRPRHVLAGRAGLVDQRNATLPVARTLAAYRLPPAEWVEPASRLAALMRVQDVVEVPGQSDPARNRPSLRAAMAELRRLGVAARNVAYVADEPDCGSLAAAERAAAAARAADPGIRPLVTIAPDACGGSAAARLPDVRVFVPTERAARGPAPPGRELWIYPNSGLAGPGYVSFALDDPGTAALLVGWRAALLRARGVLYWTADLWSRGFDPFTTPVSTGGGQYAGDGVLIYPGRRASLRLALYREGAEDADLVACAGAAGRAIAARIAPSSRALVRSPRRILAARLTLARACAA